METKSNIKEDNEMELDILISNLKNKGVKSVVEPVR